MRTRSATQIKLLTWPFRSLLTSPAWLLLRIYLASVWLQFGVGKIRGGWLDGDGLHGLLGAVAAGQTPAPFPFYAKVAELLVATGMDRVLSVAMPLVEVGVALAFITGVMLVPAAAAATLLNVNLILSGVASIHFDGRIITMQVLLLLAWRVAGYLGLGTLIRRGWRHGGGHGPLPVQPDVQPRRGEGPARGAEGRPPRPACIRIPVRGTGRRQGMSHRGPTSCSTRKALSNPCEECVWNSTSG